MCHFGYKEIINMSVDLAVEIVSTLVVLRECWRLNPRCDVTVEMCRLVVLLDGYDVGSLDELENYCVSLINKSHA